jgi:uncharacterized HAD superfamily protein
MIKQEPRKKILALDVDGTLADTLSAWLKLYNKDEHAKHTKEEIIEYELIHVFNVSYDKMKQYFIECWKHWWDIPMEDKNIPKYVRKIREKYFVIILTSSWGELDLIKTWLEKNKIEYDGLFYLKDPHKKYLFCDILVDDKLLNLNYASIHGKIGIEKWQPWSKSNENEIPGKSVTIFKSWKRIYKHLMKL